MTGSEALALADVTVRRGGRDIVASADASAPAGLVLLEGANGSGKSSLLAAIAGVLPVVRGRIRIDGHDLERDGLAAKRALGYMPERTEAFLVLTPRQWLQFVAQMRGADPTAAIAAGQQLLDATSMDAPMSMSSAGQRRKVSLAAACVGEPQLLLLDEPTNALDDAGVAAVHAIVGRWCAHGRTVVCAMHQPPPSWCAMASARWRVAAGVLRTATGPAASSDAEPG